MKIKFCNENGCWVKKPDSNKKLDYYGNRYLESLGVTDIAIIFAFGNPNEWVDGFTN